MKRSELSQSNTPAPESSPASGKPVFISNVQDTPYNRFAAHRRESPPASGKPVFVFDVDDTLYDRSVPLRKAWERVFGPQRWSDEQWHNFFIRFRFHGYELFEASMNGEVSMEEMYVYRIKAAARDFSFPLNDDQAMAFQKEYAWEQAHLVLGEDERQLLNCICSAGCRMGIITNGKTSHQLIKYTSLGLAHWIPRERCIISEEAGVSKPDPAIFRYAENKLGLSSAARNLWYIGDSPVHDIDAAAGVGWKTIWLARDQAEKTADSMPEHTPDYTVRSIREMITAVQKIIAEAAGHSQ